MGDGVVKTRGGRMKTETEKNCLTCKYEPDWDINNMGYCKKEVKLPEILPSCISKEKITKIKAMVNICDHDQVTSISRFIETCPTWEKKEEEE